MLKIEEGGKKGNYYFRFEALVLSNEVLGNYEGTVTFFFTGDKKIMREINVISEKEKAAFAWKKFFMFALIMVMAVVPIFAGNGSSATGIDSAVEKVTSFLSSGVITAVCLIALVVEGVGVVLMGKQGADIQSIIGKFSPWVVGTVVLLSANGICNYFLSDLSFSKN